MLSSGIKWPFYIESGRIHGVQKLQDWTLDEGKGPRKWTSTVIFSKPFSSPPAVVVSFALLDLINTEDVDYLVNVTAENITPTQFNVEISTWDKSSVWSVDISWIAYDKTLASKQNYIIQHGREHFNGKQPEYKLDKGDEKRSVTRHIYFPSSFQSLPQIVTSLCLINATSKSDLRLRCFSEKVTLDGFQLGMETWSDSIVKGGSVAWIAIDGGLIQNYNQGGRLQVGQYWFKKTHPGYRLHKGTGSRNLSCHIQFDQAFTAVPHVVPFLTAIDVYDQISKKERIDARISVEAEKVTATGFELKLSTWKDTHIWSATASFIAFGDAEYSAVPLTPLLLPYFPPVSLTTPIISPPMTSPSLWNLPHTTPSAIPTPSIFSMNVHSGPPTTMSQIHTITTTPTAYKGPTTMVKTSTAPKASGTVGTGLKHSVGSGGGSGCGGGGSSGGTGGTGGGGGSGGGGSGGGGSGGVGGGSGGDNVGDGIHSSKKQKTSTDTAKVTKKEEDDENECKICFDAKINTVIVPCGHLCICFECSKLLTNNPSKKNCPICKQAIQQIIKTFQT